MKRLMVGETGGYHGWRWWRAAGRERLQGLGPGPVIPFLSHHHPPIAARV